MNGSNAHRQTEARSLYTLLDFSFVVTLTIMTEVLAESKVLSDHLQSAQLQLASAVDLVKTVMSALQEKRSEKEWGNIWQEAGDIGKSFGISFPTDTRPRAQPQHLQEFVVNSSIGYRQKNLSSDEFRRNIYLPVIDTLLQEITRRFSNTACSIFKGSSALNPSDVTFLDKASISEMSRHYGIEEQNLTAELHQVSRLIERKAQQGCKIKTPLEFAAMLNPYRDAFIDLYALVCISVTLPVNSASCERSFSYLRIIKNYLRNSSSSERTSDMAVISINAKRAKALNVEDIINAFAKNHNNRRIVLL